MCCAAPFFLFFYLLGKRRERQHPCCVYVRETCNSDRQFTNLKEVYQQYIIIGA